MNRLATISGDKARALNESKGLGAGSVFLLMEITFQSGVAFQIH